MIGFRQVTLMAGFCAAGGLAAAMLPTEARAWRGDRRGEVFIGVAPQVFVAPPPVVYAPPPVVYVPPSPPYHAPQPRWVPGHYRGPYWVPAHWA